MRTHLPVLTFTIVEAVFTSSKAIRCPSTLTPTSIRSPIGMSIDQHHSIGVAFHFSKTIARTVTAVKAFILEHIITHIADSAVSRSIRTHRSMCLRAVIRAHVLRPSKVFLTRCCLTFGKFIAKFSRATLNALRKRLFVVCRTHQGIAACWASIISGPLHASKGLRGFRRETLLTMLKDTSIS